MMPETKNLLADLTLQLPPTEPVGHGNPSGTDATRFGVTRDLGDWNGLFFMSLFFICSEKEGSSLKCQPVKASEWANGCANWVHLTVQAALHSGQAMCNKENVFYFSG
jgi:hypothetical protein